MTSKCPCGRKFTKSMPNNSFHNIHVYKNPSVMHSKRMADKVRRDLTCSRPGFNWSFFSSCLLRCDLLSKSLINVRTLFCRSCHSYPYFPLFLRIYLFECFFFLRVIPTALLPAYVLGPGIPIPLLPSPPP